MKIKIKTEIPGPNARKWLERYNRYAAKSTYCYPFVWDVTKKAEGAYCTDPDGNVFLDFYGHVACAPLGYNHESILIDCGVPFDPIKIAGHDTYLAVGSDPDKNQILSMYHARDFKTATHLQEKLIEVTKQFGFDTVFLVNSGAEAVENAIKISQYRKFKKLREKLNDSQYEMLFNLLNIPRDEFILGLYRDYPIFGIACLGSFHGRTLNALTHNKSKRVQKEGFPTISWVRHIPYVTKEENFEDIICKLNNMIDKRDINDLIKTGELPYLIFEKNKIPMDLLAYVIAEPIQGEGGYIVPNPDFIRKLSEFAKENDALYISDEIQAGLGRTGKMWAIEHFGVTPDIITSAKALRLGAVISKRENFPDLEGKISSTWSGGEIATAVGYKTIEIIQEENLVENAKEKGDYIFQRLKRLSEKAHPVVMGVRGKGLMIGVDFENKEIRDKAVMQCFKNGLLTLGCGERTLRMLPPLTVTDKEIKEGLTVFEEASRELYL